MNSFKSFITVFILLFAGLSYAKTINLDYNPHGKIIRFNYEGLTVYTDTASLFSVYDQKGNLKSYSERIKVFVRKKVAESKSDTIEFSGQSIPFNDGIKGDYMDQWFIGSPVMQLTIAGKLKMFDKHGQAVTTIVTKRVGSRKKNFIKRSYINPATNEELLYQALYIRMVKKDV